MSLDGDLIQWIVVRGLILVIGTALLLLVYRVGSSAIHRLVPAVMTGQATHLLPGSTRADELGKRSRTIEDLLARLLRVGVLAGIVTLVLVVLELWPVLALIVVLLVAVVFATKDVVLDYVMGLLILIEGHFFKGDYVVVPGHAGVEGVVEEIGLRRTVLRDGFGAAHAVSNGFIRLSSNRTRLFSAAVVDVFVLHAADLDRAISLGRSVAEDLGRDEGWAERLDPELPVDVSVVAIGLDGALVRITQQVQTGLHGIVASELRRRVAAAFVGAGIATGRFDTPIRIAGDASSQAPAVSVRAT